MDADAVALAKRLALPVDDREAVTLVELLALPRIEAETDGDDVADAVALVDQLGL